MSIWRAPLLILGIIIILLAAGAIAAPWFVDFNRYKPQLEQLGTQLLGRKVRIGGDVKVVLFPWPMARLGNVQVAGDEGGRFEHLLEVEEVQARLSLAALLAARLEVEQITLRRPVLALEHAGDGKGNWLAHGSFSRLPLKAEQVALDSIHVENGQLLIADRRMRNVLNITHIDAQLKAPRMIGPWRLQGKWRLMGRMWQGRLSSGVWQADKPWSISLRMEPLDDVAGYTVRVDGALQATAEKEVVPRFEGKLVIAPSIPQGRSDPLDPVRQVEVDADILLTPDALDLTRLKIVSRFPAASPFDALRGDARLEFGSVLGARLSLKTSRLKINAQLDRLLGGMDGVLTHKDEMSDGLALLRRHLLAVARRLSELPPDLLLDVDMQANGVLVRNTMLSNVVLSVEASSELLIIHHLRASAPGQGALSFRGNLLAGDMLQLTGELDLRSEDARTLLFSASAAVRQMLAPVWRGRSGRLALLATVDLTDYALRMVSRQLKLDDAKMTLDWRLHEPEKPGAGRESMVHLGIEEMDLDRYLRSPAGVLALAEAWRKGARAAQWRWRLELTAQQLRYAGLGWRHVALSLQSQPGAFHLQKFQVANVANMTFDASGDFRIDDQGWRGGLKAHLKGENTPTLRRLAKEMVGASRMPAWASRLKGVDVSLQLALDDGHEKGRQIDASITGRLGPASLSLAAKGGLSNGKGSNWAQAVWRVQGELRSEDAERLLALGGVVLALPQGGMRASIKAEGMPAEGVQGVAELRLPGTQMRWEGKMRLAGYVENAFSALHDLSVWQGEGRVSLELANFVPWARLLGMAMPPAGQGQTSAMPLRGQAGLAFSSHRLQISNMALRAGDNNLTGSLALTWPEAGAVAGVEATAPKLAGEVIADRLDTRTLAAMLLSEPDNWQQLRRRVAGSWRLGLVLRGKELVLPWPGVMLSDGRILLRQDDEDAETLQMELAAGRKNTTLRMDARLKREELGLAVKGSMQAMLPLERIVRSDDGKVRLAGQGDLSLNFEGRPATLGGMALALKGRGKLTLQDAVLHGMAPDRLLTVVRSIGTQAELERFDVLARSALLQGEWALPEQVELKLQMADGLLEAVPSKLPMPGTKPGYARLFGLLDVAVRKLDITAEFVAKGEDAPPAFSVHLAGIPGALTLSMQWDVLRDWAQQRVIRRKEEEVKRLEERRRQLREQARLMEEKARREAARRQRQEWMRQEAARLHKQLQEVLAKAYQQIREGGSGQAAMQAGKQVGPAASIDALLRQLKEDDGQRQDKRAKKVMLPPQARATPASFANLPKPRKRPTGHAASPARKSAATLQRRRDNAGATAVSAARQRSTAAARRAGNKRTSAVGNRRQAKQGDNGRGAVIIRPLTNWNRFAPAQ